MSKRDDPQVRGQRVARILDDPEIMGAFDGIRTRIISDMEMLTLDGENDSAAAALVHKLQAAVDFKRELVSVVRAGDRAAQKEAKAASVDDLKKELFDPFAAPITQQ